MTSESLGQFTKEDLIALVLAQVEQIRAQAAQIATLTARVAELETRLGQPPKTPDNSSLPPSKGQKANRPPPGAGPKPKRRGRPGVARELAEHPDHVREVFADTCTGCGHAADPADQPDVQAYDHIDIPPLQVITTRVHLHSGTCACCGKPIAATPPADMPPGSPFGPGIAALILLLHTRHMVSFNRLQELLAELVGLDISEGAIANIWARAAKPMAAEAERIAAVVRASPVIASDETSSRVKGKTWWQWVIGSPTAVSHRIADTRGAKVVTEFMAGSRPEVWVSDRYSAQKGHADVQQVCLAHVLRDTQFAIDTGDWTFARPFKELLQEAIAVAPCRDCLDDATLAAYRGDLECELQTLLDRRPATEAGVKLSAAMARWKHCLFVFIVRRDVPPTNNVSEQRLRMSVIFRKVTNGFRSVLGSAVYADIASATATGRLHGHSALASIRRCLAGQTVLNSS